MHSHDLWQLRFMPTQTTHTALTACTVWRRHYCTRTVALIALSDIPQSTSTGGGCLQCKHNFPTTRLCSPCSQQPSPPRPNPPSSPASDRPCPSHFSQSCRHRRTQTPSPSHLLLPGLLESAPPRQSHLPLPDILGEPSLVRGHQRLERSKLEGGRKSVATRPSEHRPRVLRVGAGVERVWCGRQRALVSGKHSPASEPCPGVTRNRLRMRKEGGVVRASWVPRPRRFRLRHGWDPRPR
jgi:hypothetical protein